jgi:cell division protein FtsI (penicillin-binding protein 3)
MRLGRSMRRLWTSVVVVGLMLSVVFVRLIWLQGLDAGGYALAASDERAGLITLHASRGSILDRNGVPLAYTADAKDIVADPSMIDPGQREQYAALLAPVLNKPELAVTELLLPKSTNDRYSLLATALSPSTAKQVDDLRLNDKPLAGIYSQATLQRLYPGQTTGSNVVGLVQADGTGAAGIEYSFDALLRGTDGSVRYEKDSMGNVNPAGPIKRKNAQDGGSVRLTLDQDLQYTVQRYLDAAVRQSQARGGQVTIVNVHTGEVLALASTGSFNPQDPSTIKNGQSLDPNVQQVFEPGSANKIVTMSAAIEKGLITPNTVLTVPDNLDAGGVNIHDAWWHPVQKFTATGILAESSNVGTLLIAQKVGQQTFFDYLKKFGLGEKTGIELPGESSGLLPDISTWSPSTFTNLPIGQGVAMTSVQLASMYQTIANNGVRIPPRIVQSVTYPDGSVTPTAQPDGVQVVSSKTAQTVRTMLESVMLPGGTGKKAAIPGYRIAGKTGTAQQPDPKTGRYSDSVYWDTFAGMAPADNPQFAVAIMIDNPAHGLHGGDVAAPLFKDIASYELSAARIPPSGSQSVLVPLTLG